MVYEMLPTGSLEHYIFCIKNDTKNNNFCDIGICLPLK